jgi:methyl-accepting chemotaxis protein
MKDPEDSPRHRKRFNELLEESLAVIEELKVCTRAIADGSYGEIEELEQLVKKCQTLRAQVDKVIEEMKKISNAESNDFREQYDSLRDKLKEAQEITIQAINSLKTNMEKLDNDMILLRQKRKAFQGYEKHRL